MSAFKAYDIRGKVPDEIDEALAVQIGRAFAEVVCPEGGQVVVGQDVRTSSEMLACAVSDGLRSMGLDVARIGLCGTEEVYFATFHLEAAGGVMVTASHNPMGYNGMKLVGTRSRPISADTGLKPIEAMARAGVSARGTRGTETTIDTRPAYLDHLMSYVDVASLRPLKLVANPGNGCAGPVVDALRKHLPFSWVRILFEPDGHFPNGIPNPLLPENRSVTADAVVGADADMGIAWDGDFDRCFLFDERGNFIEGYYIVGLLAERLLARSPEGKVVHDPRLTWNTLDLVKKAGGKPVLCKSGHAFIKERMRQVDAVYGGEMSAHHYFREFAYCDSGMIPWLLVCEAVSREGALSELVGERMRLFPASGEINREVKKPDSVLTAVAAKYLDGAVDWVDGLSVEYADWRFNLRKSNTEPLIRLNVESRGDEALMKEKTAEILAFVDSL